MSNGIFRASLLGFAWLAAVAAPADEFRITGPFTHENLAVYLIHSSQRPAGQKLLTLREAMEQKKVAVYETGKVQELSIQNLSAEPVFVQAGDIVKGGQQDRVLITDLLLAPHSGQLPIAAFCVDQGRWTRRGAEPVREFSASNMSVPSKGLKMAVHEDNAQQKVWAGVAWAAGSMWGYLGSSGKVMAKTAPPGSMQMALEDKNVAAATGNYVGALEKTIDGKPDVVGYLHAVNGKVSSADVYASADLFRRMWPKLLQASAAEALAERTKAAAPPAPTAATAKQTLSGADAGRAAAPAVNGRLSVVKKESDKALLFETRDRELGGAWIHKSYIVK